MKISIECKMCSIPHFDHFECDKCHARLPTIDDDFYARQNGKWQYCPWCGEPLCDIKPSKNKKESDDPYANYRQL